MAKKKDAPEDAKNSEVEEVKEGESTGKKKPPLMILIAAGVGALVIIGGGATAAILLMGGNKTEAHGKDAKAEKPKKDEKKDEKKGGKDAKDKGPNPISQGPDGIVYYTLPDLLANIQSADGRPAYLKVRLALELKDESVAESIEPNMPRLTDILQTFMRELRPEDLAGSQGNYELRLEFQRRIDLVIAPAKVNSVLIEEMLIS